MSKNKQISPCPTNKPNSAKSIIEQAKKEVPGFSELYKKFEEKMVIGGYSAGSLYTTGCRESHFQLRLGGLCQMSLRRYRDGVGVSWPIHS